MFQCHLLFLQFTKRLVMINVKKNDLRGFRRSMFFLSYSCNRYVFQVNIHMTTLENEVFYFQSTSFININYDFGKMQLIVQLS